MQFYIINSFLRALPDLKTYNKNRIEAYKIEERMRSAINVDTLCQK